MSQKKFAESINEDKIPIEPSQPENYVAAVRNIDTSAEDVAIDLGQELADKAPLSAINNDPDFYEEGTYDPEITRGITSPTYSDREGKYVIIGNFYVVYVDITVSGGSTTDSGLRISLPFIGESGYGVVDLVNSNRNGMHMVRARDIDPDTNIIGSDRNGISGDELTNSGSVRFTITGIKP